MSGVSVQLLKAIVVGAAARAVPAEALLRAAGIAPEQLADPDGRAPRNAEIRLWHEAARLTGDDFFGLHLAELLPLADLGDVGFAVRSSVTIGEALARVARYLHLLAQGAVVEVHEAGDAAILRHRPPRGEPAPTRHAVECLLGNLVGLARRASQAAVTPRAARFRHPAPARTDEHRRVFGPGVAFGADHDELEIDGALLAQRQPEAAPMRGAFLDRVRAALEADLSGGEPTLTAVARRLRMSPRTLQRRLQHEGTSLQILTDRMRHDLAARYLDEPRASISEVAFLLGFSDVGSFHRAFKGWTGLTPAAYRRGRLRARW